MGAAKNDLLPPNIETETTMQSKQISQESRKRTHVLIFESGDKVVSELEQ
jgi:hypothetical protein